MCTIHVHRDVNKMKKKVSGTFTRVLLINSVSILFLIRN